MVHDLKGLRYVAKSDFFKSESDAQIFSVTVARYYNGHDLSTAFCYLKVRFNDGTVDKFLMGIDFDEDTVTVSAGVTARMQRVEGVAKYQLSFEHADFTVQSDVFDVLIEDAVGDAINDYPAAPEAINELQRIIEGELSAATAAIEALEQVAVGISANAVEKDTVVTKKVKRTVGGVDACAIDLTADGKVSVSCESATENGGEVMTARSVTHSQLCALIDNSELKVGEKYRITDYAFTADRAGVASAGHPFDIIVTATSADTVDENARAAQRNGDNYFEGSRLDAWEIKYSVLNDKTRFAWADTISGKGVVYFMKDEWGNEAPYDFKNALFKRTENGYDYYAYTFSSLDGHDISEVIAGTADVYDASVPNTALTYTCAASGNVIKEYVVDESDGYFDINDIVIIEDGADSCYGNYFGVSCAHVTAGANFRLNRFAGGCENFTFGDDCLNNAFGTDLSDNTFGDGCCHNKLGGGSVGNEFGDNCTHNEAGAGFSHNVVGNYSDHNHFGVNCAYCVFGNPAPGFSGVNFSYNTVGSDVRFVALSSNTGMLRYLEIAPGVCGNSELSRLSLFTPELENKSYPHYIARSSNGRITIRWRDDGDVFMLAKNSVADVNFTAVSLPSFKGLPVDYVKKSTLDNFTTALSAALATVGYLMNVASSYDATNEEYEYNITITRTA
ncbi:MAG: hypothetical protein ILP02_03370 [Clostridia bacterium]|nr:hypothetical protein [Clostridia bacterium]